MRPASTHRLQADFFNDIRTNLTFVATQYSRFEAPRIDPIKVIVGYKTETTENMVLTQLAVQCDSDCVSMEFIRLFRRQRYSLFVQKCDQKSGSNLDAPTSLT